MAESIVAVYVERLNVWRVTLTLPTINAARRVLFLVTGAAKAGVVLKGPKGQFPAQQIRPTSGQLTWLLDTASASQLRHRTRNSKHESRRGKTQP